MIGKMEVSMYGLFVAVGSAVRIFNGKDIPSIWPVPSNSEVAAPREDVRVARFEPIDAGKTGAFVWSDDRQVLVLVDGYLYTSTAPRGASREEQARSFANGCRRDGYEAAMRSIAGGTFNLVVVDLSRSLCHVSTDPIGSLTLYHSQIEGGWLLSTNPVALARSGIIDLAPDLTAMAEWAYIGYTIGDRFLLKGIRVVPPCTSFHWESTKSDGYFSGNPDSPWKIFPGKKGPSPEEVTDAFIESCRRIAILDPRPAHFQSAGKDSRFLLASWPMDYDPPCYTYGDDRSLEVSIARSVAKLRGSRWIHTWLEGDEAGEDLGRLFDSTGMIVFPDRYLAARQIRRDGFSGVLDGYLGGVFNGGGYLDCDRYFSLLSRLGRYVSVYIDQKVSNIGPERITEAILDSILEIREDDTLRGYLNRDFVARLRAEWPDILHDLHLQVERFTPANDSLAALWNDLVLANRSAHAIVQQMVIVRSFVDVYCPFSGDLELLRMLRRIPPEEAAHDRFYHRMYRRRFPDYARIVEDKSLIPITRPTLLHKTSSFFMEKGIFIPFLTGNKNGREVDANSWGRWLRQSPAMRDTALAFLREGGILDEKAGARTFDAIGAGSKRGTGKIFHMAGVAKWLAMSGVERTS